ncbi:MAG: TonB-dependent receptor [Opitutaceae bacterium]|nr:TonB-dependent receptor [Opitutaceae bacterium]
MNYPPFLRRVLAVAASLIALGCAHAMETPVAGTIEGRVFNPATGEYLENVRITIEGTALETFTDAGGQYRLTNIRPGVTPVKAFRTGAAAQSHVVTVAAGQIVTQDFNLGGSETRPAADAAITLDKFVVGASKEMDGAAIAINTQRFAPNAVNVVAADEFGTVTSGGAGEVLKSLPGIAADLGGRGEPHTMSLNGVPSGNVPITIAGFNLAQSGSTARQVGLHQITIDTFSRIEVAHTPTPETTGSALAGSINMVPRSAFERARPITNFSTALVMRDDERSLHKTPGPGRSPTNKISHPFDFSAIVPVNDRFGFTVSASTFPVYTNVDFMQNTWRGAGAATNGNALPDTTPDRPYLTDYAVRDGTSWSRRTVFATTMDYRLGRNDRLSLSFQYGLYFDEVNNRTLTFFVNRVAPGNFTPTSTHGVAGAGEIRHTNNALKWDDTLYMPTLTYRHDGPIWKAEIGAGLSRSTRNRLDLLNGHFMNVQSRRQNVTVSFDDIFYLRPGAITVTDGATGAPIDPYRLDNYFLNTATSGHLETVNVERSAFANLRRDLRWLVPITVKAGLDVRQSMRDVRQEGPTWTFVGADGRSTAANIAGSDDGAAVILDESFSQRTPAFGFPRIDWMSNEQLFDLSSRSPGYFTVNEVTRYTQRVVQSKHSEELISSAYARGDVQLLNGRLRFVGGVRAEQTNVSGEGQLIDPTRNFQRDSAGRVMLGGNGQPLPITTDALRSVQLTNVDRGLRARKEYLRFFPSLNGSYNIRENLIARAGYYWSVGRPNFNQYAGSLTLPNTENPPGPGNRISVNNAGIKAWSARTTKVTLEYYFERAGLFSVSAFRRDFENFFATSVFGVTPEFLGLYGLDPGIYGEYDVSTQTNLPSPVRMSGVDFNYKQALTFLPGWGRGLQVFANATAQRATGDESNSLSGYTPRTANWGVSFSRSKYNLRAKWNFRGRQRRGLVAAVRSIEPGTYNWGAERRLLDVSGEYFVRKNIALFFNLNNVKDAPADIEIAGPSTPSHAQLSQRSRYGSLWTFGIKGSF